MSTVLITRPQPDADRTAAEVQAHGFNPIVAPLMRIALRPHALQDAPDCDALAFTSANGVRAWRAAGGSVRPCYVVGPASAEAAREAGLPVAGVAEGDVETLAALIAKERPGRVLHVGGTALAGDLTGRLSREGLPAQAIALYEAVAETALPPEARGAICAGLSFVLLFSPRSARLFCRLVREAGLGDELRNTRCAALSPAVAEAVDIPFADVIVSDRRDLSGFVDILSARRT